MTAITSPWLFAQWGIDIMGPLPQGKKQVKFLLVAINYFTKWVEAETLTTIIEAKIQNFIWKNIVCRFGIPKMIISDNGRQFDSCKFCSFCSNLGIRQILLTGTSSSQWINRSDESNLAENHQGPISGG